MCSSWANFVYWIYLLTFSSSVLSFEYALAMKSFVFAMQKSANCHVKLSSFSHFSSLLFFLKSSMYFLNSALSSRFLAILAFWVSALLLSIVLSCSSKQFSPFKCRSTANFKRSQAILSFCAKDRESCTWIEICNCHHLKKSLRFWNEVLCRKSCVQRKKLEYRKHFLIFSTTYFISTTYWSTKKLYSPGTSLKISPLKKLRIDLNNNAGGLVLELDGILGGVHFLAARTPSRNHSPSHVLQFYFRKRIILFQECCLFWRKTRRSSLQGCEIQPQQAHLHLIWTIALLQEPSFTKILHGWSIKRPPPPNYLSPSTCHHLSSNISRIVILYLQKILELIEPQAGELHKQNLQHCEN